MLRVWISFFIAANLGCLSHTIQVIQSPTVLSAIGEQTKLECEFDIDQIEFCSFARPDGVELCQEDSFNSELVETPCHKDLDTDIEIIDKVCQLRISSVEADDFGSWTCKAMYWDEWANGTVKLRRYKQAFQGSISFETLWGDVVLKAGSEQEFQCKLELDEPFDDVFTGQIIKWELKDEFDTLDVTENGHLEKIQDENSFLSSVTLDLGYDAHGKDLYCSSPILPEDDSEDFVSLIMFDYMPPEAGSTHASVEAGGEATFTILFHAFPQVQTEQVVLRIQNQKYDMIYSDDMIYGGNTQGRVSVHDMKHLDNIQPHLHSITVTIEDVVKDDAESSYDLEILNPNKQTEKYVIPLTMSLKESASVEDEIRLPDKFDSSTSIDSVLSTDVTTANTTIEYDTLASEEGISIYVFLGILALCLLLCFVFYCFRCGRSKKKVEPEKELAPKVVQENMQPLLDDEKGNDKTLDKPTVNGSIKPTITFTDEKKDTQPELEPKMKDDASIMATTVTGDKTPEQIAIEERTLELEKLLKDCEEQPASLPQTPGKLSEEHLNLQEPEVVDQRNVHGNLNEPESRMSSSIGSEEDRNQDTDQDAEKGTEEDDLKSVISTYHMEVEQSNNSAIDNPNFQDSDGLSHSRTEQRPPKAPRTSTNRPKASVKSQDSLEDRPKLSRSSSVDAGSQTPNSLSSDRRFDFGFDENDTDALKKKVEQLEEEIRVVKRTVSNISLNSPKASS